VYIGEGIMVWRKTKNTALSESGKFKSMWTPKKREKALQMYVDEKLSLTQIAYQTGTTTQNHQISNNIQLQVYGKTVLFYFGSG
jgi:hypothetical protein